METKEQPDGSNNSPLINPGNVPICFYTQHTTQIYNAWNTLHLVLKYLLLL